MVNEMTIKPPPKLIEMAKLLVGTKSGSESLLAEKVMSGGVELSAVFCWTLALATGNDIDRLARRPEVQRLATEALRQLLAAVSGSASADKAVVSVANQARDFLCESLLKELRG
jgi:hypothetical protein